LPDFALADVSVFRREKKFALRVSGGMFIPSKIGKITLARSEKMVRSINGYDNLKIEK